MPQNPSFTIKQGDTRPSFEYQFRRNNDPIDIRNADTIRFRVSDLDGSTLYINSEAVPTEPGNGEVRYTLSGDESLPVGSHRAELEIFWGAGATETFPKSGYFEIEVNEPLGDLDPTDISDPDVTVTTVYTDEIAANSQEPISVRNALDLLGNDITNIGSLGVDSYPLPTWTLGESTDGTQFNLTHPDSGTSNPLEVDTDGSARFGGDLNATRPWVENAIGTVESQSYPLPNWVIEESTDGTQFSLTHPNSGTSNPLEVDPDGSARFGGDLNATRPWVENADHTTSGDWTFNGLTNIPYVDGEVVQTISDPTWYKIGTLTGGGANCKVLITETSRTGNPYETGIEFASFKNGNDTGEHGGWWYQLNRHMGRILEGDFGFVNQSDSSTGLIEMDIYYKAGPYTRASCIVLEGEGLDYDYTDAGTTEPTGITYLDNVFPIASPLELANGISSDLDVAGTLTSTGTINANSDLNVSGTLTSTGAINANSNLDVAGTLTSTGAINANGEINANAAINTDGTINAPAGSNLYANLYGSTTNDAFTVYDRDAVRSVFTVRQDTSAQLYGPLTAERYAGTDDGASGGLSVNNVNYSEFNGAARIYNTTASPSWAFRYDGASGWTNAFNANPDGFGNPGGISNLSGTTGNFDGEERLDDGTNTPARGTKCVWDDVNAVWRPQHDPTQSFV